MKDAMPDAQYIVMTLIAMGTALWGWLGWLVLIWIVCMVLDYVSGSLASVKAHEWNSQRAREGLWHKGGMILIVIVSAIGDLVLRLLLHMDGLRLPLDYTVFLCPVVLVWYVLTELGSILENAALLGTRVPAWFPKWMKISADLIDRTGEQLAEAQRTDGGEPDKNLTEPYAADVRQDGGIGADSNAEDTGERHADS